MQGRELTIVGEASDLGVSGTVSPFEREGLGPWLTDNPPQPWDVLVAWRLDRVSRSVLDTLLLVKWLHERGKHLVTVSDGLDTSTPMGKVFVQLASIFAELERNIIQERTADSRAELKEQGRWGGEAVHYGLKSAPLEGGGYKLVLDDVGAKWLNQVADWVIEGESVAGAARRLQSKRVLAPRDRQRQIRNQPIKGDKWSDSTLMQILRSKTLLGWTVSDGVADSTLMKSPPIMSALKFQRLQMALERNAKPQTRPAKAGSAPLSGVAICWKCKEALWHRAQHMPAGRGRMKTSTTYRYYYCKGKGHTKSIRADELEELCESTFLATYADVEVTEPVVIPATDYDEQIAEAELAVENLSQQLAKAKTATLQRIISQQLEEWDSLLAHYQSLPTTPGGIEHVPTGRTWKQELDSLDDEGKRMLWKRVGFRFAASKDADGNHLSIQPPDGQKLYTLKVSDQMDDEAVLYHSIDLDESTVEGQ
jgi:DNA invertase Pin-like site-specific DNA recombinase